MTTGGRITQATEPPADGTTIDVTQVRHELADALERLVEYEQALRAISQGEVDALVIGSTPGEEQIFTLSGADRAYRHFVENMSDGAATVSIDGIVLYANQALADLLGTSCEQIVGRPLAALLDGATREHLAQMVGPHSSGGSFEAALLGSDDRTVPVLIGSSLADERDSETLICITVTDLTRERQAEAAVTYSAQHDTLTGLPNRGLLNDRIEHALARRASDKNVMALLFCDLDGFKNINDAHGHQVGDETLRVVSQRLASAVRPEDTVARIGGDEFVVLCEGLEDMTDAAVVASRVRAAASAPFTAGALTLDVTVSIGVAVASVDDHDASADTLLRDADEAMYKAKRQGPNVIELFDEQLRVVAKSRLRLLAELHSAVEDDQLRLHYQPVVSLDDEKVVGLEALLRWEHPHLGLVAPDDFVPFAERSGLITGIGAWVMGEACRQASEWRRTEPHRALDMAVNVSARQLAQGAGLVESTRLALRDSGLDPTSVVLEVTESALVDDAEAALRVLKELKTLGVRIAIDDFGTGYSSLVYLKRFPVDLLKIDRSFIAGLGLNKDDDAIVRSVIELAHAFGIDAVAEGIETWEHLEILRDLGCDFGQGYLWSPPQPALHHAPTLPGAARAAGRRMPQPLAHTGSTNRRPV
jgi:diguanylate cyclase (GGDEF)-like protein/PAS domain S-box-containing protein